MKRFLVYIIFALSLTSCIVPSKVTVVDDYPQSTVIYKSYHAPWIYSPHRWYIYEPRYKYVTPPYDPRRRPYISKPSAKPNKPHHDRPNRKSKPNRQRR